jgi:hypothetical protein
MGYVNLKSTFGIGDLQGLNLTSAPSSSSSYRINKVNGFMGGAFSLDKDGVISDLGFYVVSIVGTGTYSASIVTFDSNNDATNIDYGGSTGTILLPGQINTGWNWITLNQSATGSAGDLVCVRLKASFADASNYLGMPANGLDNFSYLPVIYGTSDVGTGTAAGRPLCAVRYNDDHVYGYPIRTGYSNTYTSGSSTNYYGMKFSPPLDVKCNGIRLTGGGLATNAKGTIFVYDQADAVLVQAPIQLASNTAYSNLIYANVSDIMFDEINLSGNNWYRVVIRADNNRNCGSSGLTLITGTYRYAFSNGEYCMRTYRTGTSGYTFGSAWIDDEFSCPNMALLLTNIEYSTGTSTPGGTTTSSNYYGWAS